MELWLAKLRAGDARTAWDLFAERYRNLMLATIRRFVPDHDDVMDVFAIACAALVENDFHRLRQYSERAPRTAQVSTWLVAVIRNLTIDWLRARDGRRRTAVPEHLTPRQRLIYAALCVEGRSHVEAYEAIRARTGSGERFHEFLREVRATQLAAPCPGDGLSKSAAHEPTLQVPLELAAANDDPAESAESVRRVGAALASQQPDVRLAVELFVVERMAAADVARVVGWPNAKTVYNRVYRALSAIRVVLEADGIGPGDL